MCFSWFNLDLKGRGISCSECRCGYRSGSRGRYCKRCPHTDGCILKGERILSSCDECEYDYHQRFDSHYCRKCCRVYGNQNRCIPCSQCPLGHISNNIDSRGYCNCPCGVCRYGGGQPECCVCGCQCGTCRRTPSFADILSPTGLTSWKCCSPCQVSTRVECFPSIARVSLENGKSVTMAELQVGDKVKAGKQMHYFSILVQYMFDSCLKSEQLIHFIIFISIANDCIYLQMITF